MGEPQTVGHIAIQLSTFTTLHLFRTIRSHARALRTLPVMVEFIRRSIMIGKPRATVDPPPPVMIWRWGSQTTTSTLIDVQGFVYWDPDHLTVQWHSFSGWEIHPLTAWRQHQSNQTPDFSISPSPSSFSVPPGASGTSTITLTSLGSFTGTVTLSPSISPNGPTISVNPSSVTLVAGGSETSKLTVSTQSSTQLAH